MTRSNASTGRIYFWQGGSLWIGQGQGRTQWHAHHAHQLVVAPAGRFRFRTGETGDWESYAGALVPSHCNHQFEVDGLAVAHLFVEPESRAGRALSERFGGTAVARIAAQEACDVARQLFRAFAATPAREPMVDAASRAVARLAGATTEPDRAAGLRP